MSEISKVVELGKAIREQMLARNTYKKGSNEYNATNPDALSNGDSKGREPISDGREAGNSLDIAIRKQMLARNKYGKDKPYSVVD